MLAELPVQFDRPVWLLLLALIVPCYLMARRSIGGLTRSKATLIFALRTVVILLLATALAKPIWEKRGKGLTVTVVLDRSQSIPLPLKASSATFLEKAAQTNERRREDRIATITIAKDANIAAMPDALSEVRPTGDDGDLTATNLAAGVRMALAIMPQDTANRIVIASDGNETVDSVMQAAEIARANKVPIDVLRLEYQHKNEVIFEKISAPPRSRQGQNVTVKMVLRAQNDAAGTLRLKLNGVPVDLDPEAPGDGLHVNLKAGLASTFPMTVDLEESGPAQFDAVFEPDNVADDEIVENNSAVGVTFVGGEGKVLIIDDGTAESEYLIRALNESNIAVDRRGLGAIGSGPVFLSGYDAVVLANIHRAAFDDDQDRMFHSYVHDLGGGLVMLGGPDSFGAGGWIDSETSKVLPVKLDPPQTRQMLRGALALVMHSCEMAQGNFWGQKVAISAIQALSSQDYVGIVVYGWGQPGVGGVNASWAFPMSIAGDKSAPIAAAKKMQVGDMPSFDDSLTVAFQGLMSVRAGQRHAIIISDGDPQPPQPALLQKYIDNKITVTTIMVAGHGSPSDNASMKNTAEKTGGRFYNITNPKNLPQIFIKEAQMVSRSLIQEGDTYQPRVATRLPGPTEGFTAVPAIDGYVLTVPRDGLAQVPIVLDTSEGADPIFAYWNYGLGKSIAYTSDLTGRWGSKWASWAEFKKFWEQSIRWVMRPSSPINFTVNTRQEGDKAFVEVEALDANAAFLNFLTTSAVVLGPDNTAQPLSLQQIGPGRYRGEFTTSDAGAYLVNVSYAVGGGEDAKGRGSLQAAVCVPYAPEFRATQDNFAKLKELAEATGGRVLSDKDPSIVNLFDAEKLEIPKSPRDMWDLMAIIAAALFVIDVASRRISIDPKWVAGLAGKAVGRRQEAGGDTVEAWKRARTQSRDGGRKVEVAKPAEPVDRSARFEATEADAKHAIDVASERPTDVRVKPQGPVQPQKPAAPGEADDGDYTSRLLKAKRRARGGDEESPGGGESGGKGPKEPNHG